MSTPIDRRSFLKLVGVGAGAGLLPACTDAPVQHLYAYLTPPGEIVPGKATWYATVCRDCPAGCGLHVRTREARPVKLEGNPASPVNRGALCLRGQSALQALYNPDRYLRAQVGKPGHTQPVSAERALAYVAKRVGGVQGRPGAGEKLIGLVTGAQTASSAFVCQSFSQRTNAVWVSWEPIQYPALKKASALLFDRDVVPRFDLTASDFVLNLGADLVESFQSPVEYARQLTRVHSFDGHGSVPFVCVGPRRDLTTVSADEWISIRPGTQAWIALGLARELLPGCHLDEESRKRVAGMLAPYSLTEASRRAGCDLSRLKRLAARMAEAQKPVALPPGEHLLGRGATFEQSAVLLLDHVLGALGSSVIFDPHAPYNGIDPAAELAELLERARKGELSALVIAGCNPAYDWPDQAGLREALAKVPLVIRIAEARDETGELAQVILPASHFLESWGDHRPRQDWISVQQPVIQPSGDSRQSEDWLIALAASLGMALPWADFRQCLAQRWAGMQLATAPTSDSTRFFEEALSIGGRVLPVEESIEPISPPMAGDGPVLDEGKPGEDLPAKDGPEPEAAPASAGGDRPAAIAAVPVPADPTTAVVATPKSDPMAEPTSQRPAQQGVVLTATSLPKPSSHRESEVALRLVVYPSGKLYDGRTANRPWIQEYPDALTQTAWDTPVEVSTNLAARIGFTSGDQVDISGAGGKLSATIRVLPGMRDDLVAMPIGGGRMDSGRTASGLGARAWSLLELALDPIGGGLAGLQTSVEIKKVATGELVTVEGDPTTHGRPIVPTVSLEDAQAGVFPRQTLHGVVMVDVETGRVVRAAEGRHTPSDPPREKARKAGERPEGSFYPAHDFPEHMWGMVVDLDKCTGCGACVVACQAENNVATVGADGILKGREMQWIRIERYWTEAAGLDGPVPRLIPVMCQHCEKAPCEPVCPVFASYHTRDGLNAQIYNRCVGTRYCANNCPYKVRRFNWFDHAWEAPLEQQLNPDVVVRSVGVMEKCTLCVQRIREQYNLAKAEGRPLNDQQIIPACAQTCPAGAIRFGDRKREDSAVSELARDPRAYRLLDYYLDTKPAISYLCKVDRSERSPKGSSHG